MNYFLKNKNIEITPEELADLNRQAGEKKGIWPEEGTKYWYIDSFGDKTSSLWGSTPCDKFRFLSGNFFFTEEAVDKRLEYLEALHSIRQFVLEEGLELKPDWSNGDQEKWFIWKECSGNLIVCYTDRIYHGPPDLPYFKSKKDAEKVTDAKRKELEIIFSYPSC